MHRRQDKDQKIYVASLGECPDSIRSPSAPACPPHEISSCPPCTSSAPDRPRPRPSPPGSPCLPSFLSFLPVFSLSLILPRFLSGAIWSNHGAALVKPAAFQGPAAAHLDLAAAVIPHAQPVRPRPATQSTPEQPWRRLRETRRLARSRRHSPGFGRHRSPIGRRPLQESRIPARRLVESLRSGSIGRCRWVDPARRLSTFLLLHFRALLPPSCAAQRRLPVMAAPCNKD